MVRPLVHSIVIPWVCGINDEDDYNIAQFYDKPVKVPYEIVTSEISIIEKDGEKTYTTFDVINISDAKYTFKVINKNLEEAININTPTPSDEIVDKNLMTVGFYLESNSSKNQLTIGNDLYRLVLRSDGNLVITTGDDIIWESGTSFIGKMATKSRFYIQKNGHLVIEAMNFLVDGYRKNEWIKVWDSLPNNLDFTVGVSPRDNYRLILAPPTEDLSPSYRARLELYDEMGSLIWSSEKNLCKHYKGYIMPIKYGIPTKELTPVKNSSEPDKYCFKNEYCDIHNRILTNIEYVHKGKYTSRSHACSNNVFLYENQGMISPNGRYKFILGGNGNVIFKDGSRTMWESNTANRWFAQPPYHMFVNDLGELVTRDSLNYTIFSTYIHKSIDFH